MDLSNALLKSATTVMAAPELHPPPPLRLAPAIALPATPDISADVPFPPGEATPQR